MGEQGHWVIVRLGNDTLKFDTSTGETYVLTVDREVQHGSITIAEWRYVATSQEGMPSDDDEASIPPGGIARRQGH